MCVRFGATFKCRGCGRVYAVIEAYDTEVYWELCDKAKGSLHRRPCYRGFGDIPACRYKRFEGDCTAPGRPCTRTRVQPFRPEPPPAPAPRPSARSGGGGGGTVVTTTLALGAALRPWTWLAATVGWLTVCPGSGTLSRRGAEAPGETGQRAGPALPAGCLVLPDDDEEYMSLTKGIRA
ncbi:hypothetical protein RB597_007264 [Gaeumannomyces tritici]